MSKKNKHFNKDLPSKGNTDMNEETNNETVVDTEQQTSGQEEGNAGTTDQQTEVTTTDATTEVNDDSSETTTVNTPETATVSETAAVQSPDAVSTKAEIIDTKNEVLTKFQEYVKNILTTGSEAEKNLVIGLEQYIEKVAPNKPIDPVEGVNTQRSLLELIRGVTHTTDKPLFNKLWKILINYFAEYSGKNQVFHEMYINRFTEHWPAGPVQLDAFRNITHLLRVTCENKASVKEVNKLVVVDRVLNNYFLEHARNNVIEFYNK